MNIIVLTSIRPDKNNKGGPSALIWECIRILRQASCKVSLEVIPPSSRLEQLCLYTKKRNLTSEYDVILIYPFNVFFSLNTRHRSKALVLGPDAPSLLFARLSKFSTLGINKIKYHLLKLWFLLLEQKLLKQCRQYLIVGKNDHRWLRMNNDKNVKEKASYLTHPVLQAIVEDFSLVKTSLSKRFCLRNESERILVFAGDLSSKYVGNLISDIAKILPSLEIDVTVVGRGNKWVYDLFLREKKIGVHYLEWVERYIDICDPNRYIHVVPLVAGAGTKNRVLSAIASGVPLISTYIGLENVKYCKPETQIYKFGSATQLVEAVVKISPQDSSTTGSELFIDRVNSRFSKELLSHLKLEDVT